MPFQKKAYPNWFINKIITKFENSTFNNTNDCIFSNTQEIEKEFAFGIPYIGKPSHTYSKKLRALIKNEFNVNMNIYFRSFKVGNYFQLKCSTPTAALSSNVDYKFSCPCDTATSYIEYTTRHLITRAHEHLNLNSIAKSAIKDHIYSCLHCSKTDLSASNFEVIKKCNTGFEAKIQEALLIKKYNPT